jgi:hypothetical protein
MTKLKPMQTGAALLIMLTSVSSALNAQDQDDNKSVPANAPLAWVVPYQDWRDQSGQCVAGKICWPNLTKDQRDQLLNQSETNTKVYRKEEDGGLSYLSAGIGAEKGTYRVVQYIMKYMTQPCRPGNFDAGFYRVGVGVKVQVDITTKKKNLSLGSLLPITFSANQKKLDGSITINGWGISTTNGVLQTYMGFGGKVEDPAAVTKAIESMAVANAIITDDDTVFLPYILTKQEAVPGACDAATAR